MFDRMTCLYSAYSIAHRNSDIFWKLDNGKRLNIAIKIVKGDWAYVSNFFNERLNARGVARDVVANISENFRLRLEQMNIRQESHGGYTALLTQSRKAILGRDCGVDRSVLDWALQEVCWDATLGAAAEPLRLLSPRHPPDASQKNWGSVRSKDVNAALAASQRVEPSKNGTISGDQLLTLVGEHFDVFAGPIWMHKEAALSLDEYFGLACAIHVLDRFVDTDLYTERDADLLKRLLTENDDRLTPDKNDRRDREKHDGIKSRMVEAVYDHYFGTESTCNLSDADRRRFDKEYREATTTQAKVAALKTGLSLMVKDVLRKDPIVAMLQDLALTRHPAGRTNHEAMLVDVPSPGKRESVSESLVSSSSD